MLTLAEMARINGNHRGKSTCKILTVQHHNCTTGRTLELNTEPLDQGTLERQYEELQKMRDADAPDFIIETLTLFCNMTEQRLKEIEKHSTPYLDIPEVAVYIHTIKGGSLTLGCKNLTAACDEFARCSDRNYIAGCHKALMQVVNEFSRVKEVFQKVIELERKIFNLPALPPPQA
ncbi:histidine-containing phosphotransfer protein 1-like isoform X3 [Papaver somniferum]|nr:histidine-containing phosphotransfer protein 1-like isoform X3 [Papaver somniferum]